MNQFDPVVEKPSLAWQRYHISLEDGGPLYKETNPHHFIVEPWNAVSSLFILFPALYWAAKLKRRYHQYPFITFCIPLLFLGGLGSTLFHAFRASPVLLYMDVLPTALLTLSLGIYFWTKATHKWWLATMVVLFSVLCRVWIYYHFPSHTAINLAYAITGTIIFAPLLYMMAKTYFHEGLSIILAAIFFALSLFFRETDAWSYQIFPMGTHFLWHIFSGAGAFFLAKYLYFMESSTSKRKEKEPENKEIA